MSIDKEYYFLHFSNSLVTDRIVDTRATQNIFLEQKMPTHPLPPPPSMNVLNIMCTFSLFLIKSKQYI